jgi:hypothetical protein
MFNSDTKVYLSAACLEQRWQETFCHQQGLAVIEQVGASSKHGALRLLQQGNFDIAPT